MTEIRYCANCGKVIRRPAKMGARKYACRRYCSVRCNSKSLSGAAKKTKTSGKNEWQKHAQDTWRLAVSRNRKPAPAGTYFETVEEYIARGGSITRCPPMGATGDIPPEVAA